ncbi:hypothetical protein ACFO0M_07925 [Micromonospora mangrovi]|uniref:Uncharacterized protein n=2 Tax=Micromonospora TaxID=1873 RepID=A0AAU8HME5_9ACTN
MKAHRTDLVSFAFGLAFLALSVWWLLAQILGLTLPPVGWFLAGALLLVGLLGLLGALRSGRPADRGTPADATVSASYEEPREWSAPVPPRADEWSTDAVDDVPVEAVRDRPADDPDGDPRWSPVPPVDERAPEREPRTGDDAAVTREQPTVGEAPGRPDGERPPA